MKKTSEGVSGLGMGSQLDLDYRPPTVVANSVDRKTVETTVPNDSLTVLSLGIIDCLNYGGEELLQ